MSEIILNYMANSLALEIFSFSLLAIWIPLEIYCGWKDYA